ncbi:hypothetical protein ACES2I_08650 [Bdellovibrio bacteriovorus]|uniref:hypothetical protein n=1 Tax=Bdellovibrio bacteriovorus TaxID=959 RepID=UPI0035A593F7
MNKALLLVTLLMGPFCYANTCSELLAKTKVGGETISVESLKSDLIKSTFKNLLTTPELAGYPVTCHGSAVDLSLGNDAVTGGVFLIKADRYSQELIREYKLNGDLMFEDSEYWDPSDLSALGTLNLPPALLPNKVPALLESKYLFTSKLKTVPEKYTKHVVTLVDKETTEAIVLLLQVHE